MFDLTKKKYSKKKSWKKVCKKIQKKGYIYNKIDSSWFELFNQLSSDNRFEKISDTLAGLAKDRNQSIYLYPKPTYVFEAFRVTALEDIKVVFVGQDPYFNHEYYKKKVVPQAMGLSFSVPHDVKIPSSLDNIYKNLLRFGHIDWFPKTGNLSFWAHQGCMMLNTALTVIDGNKNCHAALWNWFTNRILQYISEKSKYVVFVLWGAPALSKSVFIDLDKHDCIISSHPSGLSADKPLKCYPSFNENDHFGKINEFLENKKIGKIVWQI